MMAEVRPRHANNGMGVVANAHLAAGLCDASLLEYPYDPPEWDVDRRDYMMAEALRVGADGHIVFSRNGIESRDGTAREHAHRSSLRASP